MNIVAVDIKLRTSHHKAYRDHEEKLQTTQLLGSSLYVHCAFMIKYRIYSSHDTEKHLNLVFGALGRSESVAHMNAGGGLNLNHF